MGRKSERWKEKEREIEKKKRVIVTLKIHKK